MLTPKNATAKWLLLSEYIATVDEHKGNSNLCCIILQDKNTDQCAPHVGPAALPRGSTVGPTVVGPTISTWQSWVPLVPRGRCGAHSGATCPCGSHSFQVAVVGPPFVATWQSWVPWVPRGRSGP